VKLHERRGVALAVLALSGALALSGCSSNNSSSNTTTSAATSAAATTSAAETSAAETSPAETSSAGSSESSAASSSESSAASSESSSAGSGSITPSDITVTFLPKNLGNPYFDTSDAGGKEAVESFGGTFQQVGPDKASPDAQVPFINTATQQGVNALVISANDPKALCSAISDAQAAGVKVVTFDSDTDPSCRDLFINQATAEGIAKVQIDEIAKQIGDSGEIAILSASANATNQNAWIELMKKDLAANHPNIKLVDTVYGDDDDQTSFDKTAALLQAHPDLKGIISPTTVGIAAAARYLSTSSSKGKVALTGLGTPNQMRTYVEDGTVTSFALWNPHDLGYLAAFAAKALVDGTITGKEGDKFSAGTLGDFTVGPDATVLLGDPYVFDKANIGNFNF
jgi:rhamnose transport system substrate-binding protein